MRDTTKAERKAFIAAHRDKMTSLLAQARQFVVAGCKCDEDAVLIQQIDFELEEADRRLLTKYRRAP